MRPIRFLLPGTTGRFRCGGLLVELQTARLVGAAGPHRGGHLPAAGARPSLSRRPAAAGAEAWPCPLDRELGLRRARAAASACAAGRWPTTPTAAATASRLPRRRAGAGRQPQHPRLLGRPRPAQSPVPGAQRPARPSGWSGATARTPRAAGGPSTCWCSSARPAATCWRPWCRPCADGACGWRSRAAGWRIWWICSTAPTVLLYDSADYWRGRGVSEGFGLPPVEALACGCVVFSSLNHALADSLDPGLVGHQIGCGSLESDLERIQAAVADPPDWRPPPERLTTAAGGLQRAGAAGALAHRPGGHRRPLGPPAPGGGGSAACTLPPALRIDQWRRRVSAMWRSLN